MSNKRNRVVKAVAAGGVVAAASVLGIGAASAAPAPLALSPSAVDAAVAKPLPGTGFPRGIPAPDGRWATIVAGPTEIVPIWLCCGVPADFLDYFDQGNPAVDIPALEQGLARGF